MATCHPERTTRAHTTAATPGQLAEQRHIPDPADTAPAALVPGANATNGRSTAKRRFLNHRDIAARLRANPEQWQVVAETRPGPSYSRYLARRIAKGETAVYRPAGAFEARVERGQDTDTVYARYVGHDHARAA
ncbi:hypothetical protein F0L17_14220 [Streptomyces sp. TRM43335]|uniref:Uncharacterized protein n=1 Tax=Streptomyces taklimakanensis TaxID=2569853 RepID=A0A6G2BDV5_9ACTN|nr:hypothetical protein [Streptomyces taklimakanensis]MTE20243.1 hypothetical protein [Streptomyces taklimakanensis]